MLTGSALRRAMRQMRLYGEIGPGRDRGERRAVPPPEGKGGAPAGPARARVWDEARGAHLLREVPREP